MTFSKRYCMSDLTQRSSLVVLAIALLILSFTVISAQAQDGGSSSITSSQQQQDQEELPPITPLSAAADPTLPPTPTPLTPRQKRAQKRADKDANTQFGINILLLVILLLFIPPIFLCVYELYRDPATPVLAGLLWMRAKEVIGYDPTLSDADLERSRRKIALGGGGGGGGGKKKRRNIISTLLSSTATTEIETEERREGQLGKNVGVVVGDATTTQTDDDSIPTRAAPWSSLLLDDQNTDEGILEETVVGRALADQLLRGVAKRKEKETLAAFSASGGGEEQEGGEVNRHEAAQVVGRGTIGNNTLRKRPPVSNMGGTGNNRATGPVSNAALRAQLLDRSAALK